MTGPVILTRAVKRQAGVFLILALLAASALYFFAAREAVHAGTRENPENTDWVKVRKGDFEILYRDEGDLRPVKVTALSFLRWGKVSHLVPEGTVVKKGDKLVGMETKDLEDQARQHQEDLTVAQRNLAQQEQLRDLELKRLQTDLMAEKDRAALAALKEQDILSHPSNIEKEEARNILEGAQAGLAAAQADLEAFEPLVGKGFGKVSELDAKRTALEKSRIELQRAEMKTRQVLAGKKAEERQKAALEREQGALGLKLKEIDFEDQADNLNAKVRGNQREVEHIQRKLDRSNLQLEKSWLAAPHDGIVVYRMVRQGNKKIEIGEWVGPWFSPVELPNYEKMKVRTQVPESFVRRLEARFEGQPDGSGRREGSKARVIVKTLPDRVYNARVTWIDGWARDRNAKLSEADIRAQGLSGVRVFDVEVELEESDPQRLREGFKASVEFPVETLTNVISLPVRAVSNREGLPHVQVLKDGAAVWRKVELGPQSMERVVIKSGLEEGDNVLVVRAIQSKSDSDGADKPPAQEGEKTQPRAGAAGTGSPGGGPGSAGGASADGPRPGGGRNGSNGGGGAGGPSGPGGGRRSRP